MSFLLDSCKMFKNKYKQNGKYNFNHTFFVKKLPRNSKVHKTIIQYLHVPAELSHTNQITPS